MKRTMMVLLAAATMLISPLASSAEMMGMDPGMDMMPPGMMGGMGMGMGPGSCGMMDCPMAETGGGMGRNWMQAVWSLDLTAEQRNKIRSIHDDLRREHWDLKGKMMDENVKLRDLTDGDTLDKKRIGTVIDAINGLKKQMVLSGIDAMNKAQALLTPEQKKQLSSLRAGRAPCGMMGGMGAGHRHGMMH